jgi:PAS domain S-box-containing protein
MTKRASLSDRKSLSTQMVASFAALTLLTAVAVGLPAIWLIRGQLENQAWAQVHQGLQATRALYAAQQSELAGLATLTAQRPTLAALVEQRDAAALEAYLDTLRQGADLSLIAVCDEANRSVAQVQASSAALLPPVCNDPLDSIVVATQPSGVLPQVWLRAAQHLALDDRAAPWTVVVARWLDEAHTRQMRSQTGLENTLLVGHLPATTSLPGGIVQTRQAEAAIGDDRMTFTWDGHPYYAARLALTPPLADPPVQVEVALPVADVAATQPRLLLVLLWSIALAMAAGLLLAFWLARRISRPLADLAGAASALSEGDFANSLAIDTAVRVREVALVAQALETARCDLQATLGELRRAKAWTDHLLGAIVEGIVTLDQQGGITFFSHGAERITGWRRDQVLGRSCDQVFRTADTGLAFSELIPPPGGRSKIAVELHNGQEAILAVSGARLLPPEGGDARVALVFRDISEEEAMHRLLSHFLANVSHELRTPLSAVAASVELLLDQAPELSTAEVQELLAALHLGVLSLQKLIDNLLESASIEAGRFRVHVRPANLGEIIAEAIRTMQPLLDKHGQRLTVELPAAIPVVQADPRRLVQVLVNLLSNASNAQRGLADAAIDLSVTVTDGWARISVADRGPGIAPDMRGRDLFRRFVPPADGSRQQVGFGLGLSVVKAIVDGHGGQVGIDDRSGGGALFWFTLPLCPQQRTNRNSLPNAQSTQLPSSSP